MGSLTSLACVALALILSSNSRKCKDTFPKTILKSNSPVLFPTPASLLLPCVSESTELAESSTYHHVPVCTRPGRIRAVFFGPSPAQLNEKDGGWRDSVCVCTHHGVLSLLHDLLHFVSSLHVFISIVTASVSRGLERKWDRND